MPVDKHEDGASEFLSLDKPSMKPGTVLGEMGQQVSNCDAGSFHCRAFRLVIFRRLEKNCMSTGLLSWPDQDMIQQCG